MSDVHVLAIDLAKRSFQVLADGSRWGVCGCPRFCKGILLAGLCSGCFNRSVVCQAFDRGLTPRGRYAVRGTGSTSVQRALMLEPRDWFSFLNFEVICLHRSSVRSPRWSLAAPSCVRTQLGIRSKAADLTLHPVILLPRHHRPDVARHLVGTSANGAPSWAEGRGRCGAQPAIRHEPALAD